MNQKFMEFISSRREEMGLSRNQFAQISGISATELARIENKDNHNPSLKTMQKLAHALEISLEEILIISGQLKPLKKPRQIKQEPEISNDEKQVFIKLYVDALKNGLLRIIPDRLWPLYSAIAAYMDENNTCFPSQERLAADLGVSRQTINSRIKELQKIRWNNELIIKVTPRYRQSSIYELNRSIFCMGRQPQDTVNPDSNSSEKTEQSELVSNHSDKGIKPENTEVLADPVQDSQKIFDTKKKEYDLEFEYDQNDVKFDSQKIINYFSAKIDKIPAMEGFLKQWVGKYGADLVKMAIEVVGKYTKKIMSLPRFMETVLQNPVRSRQFLEPRISYDPSKKQKIFSQGDSKKKSLIQSLYMS